MSMESLSLRAPHRRNQSQPHSKYSDVGNDMGRGSSSAQDPLRLICGRGFVRLVLVSAILWMLLILAALALHLWSCHSSIPFLTALCKKDSKVLVILDTMGLTPKPQHRCPIPLADDPDAVIIPERTPDVIPKSLSYILVDENDAQTPALFGGNQSWSDRERSFNLNANMKVHCGFTKTGGADMDAIDVKYVKKCRFVVASGIFDGYDTPHQPSNISVRSQKLFCFLMVVDDISLNFIKENVSVRVDADGGKWVGIWRLVTLHNPPYDEPRRNGKVPKILTHRLFPQARYSIWIDGKMEQLSICCLYLKGGLVLSPCIVELSHFFHHSYIKDTGNHISLIFFP